MKKYITIAALLAAGTAFANAAESGTLTLTGGTTYDAGTTVGAITLSQDMTTGTFAAWQVQPAGTDGVLPSIYGGDFYAGDYTLSLWLDTSALSSVTGELLLFAYSGSVSSNTYGYNALVWDATNSCFKMGRGNFTANNMGVAWAGTDYASSSTVTLSEGNLHNVTIAVSGANQSQTATYWVDGIELGTADSYAGNMNNKDEKMGYYFNTNVTYGDISLTNEKLTTQADIIAFAAPVPEPSAFGMLAGLGALALVASRRRRR